MSNLDPLPFVDDRLPGTFALERSESQWLLTLLSADELRYIFEGVIDDDTYGCQGDRHSRAR